MGTKQNPPPPPDYTGAAQAQAQGNLNMASQQTNANRVNQVTPYGNLTYSQAPSTFDQNAYNQAYSDWQAKGQAIQSQLASTSDPTQIQNILAQNASYFQNGPPTKDRFTSQGRWTATTNLSPGQQAMLNSQQGLSQQYLGIAQQGLNAISPLLQNPNIDRNLPQMPQNAGQTSQDVIMARLQPQIARENAALDAKLANQGIVPGSEAYNTAKTLQAQQHNDMLTQAAGQSIGLDMSARNQAIQNNAAIMNQPLNVINALRTGAQVSTPQFQNVPQQQFVGGPDLLNAMNAGYQAQVGNTNAQNAQTAGMFGTIANLGSSYLMGGR